MKSKKKLPLLFGTLAAGVVCLTLGVGVLGATPVPQTPLQQTTASPLGLNPETDPVIMTTADGIEIRLGGAGDPIANHYDLITQGGYAYFTTSGTAGSVNWVIIGYNNVTSNVRISGSGITEETIQKEITTTETETAYTIDSFDKYASIRELSEDDEYTREDPDPHSGSLSQSPITYDPNDPIMSAIANDPVTWYQINYTHEVTTTTTTSVKTYNFPNAKSPANGDKYKEIPEGCVLVISEYLLFDEYFKASGDFSGNMYFSGYKLYDAMNAIANSNKSYATHNCDYGLDDLGLYGINENGKIMPRTLYTNYYDSTSSSVKSKELTNQYVFPLAQSLDGGNSGTPQNFIIENYLNSRYATGYSSSGNASDWWLRSGYYNSSYYACSVLGTGNLNGDGVGGNYGVRPAFVLNLSDGVPSNYWDGTAASGFARGTGTEADPYIIITPQQLAYLASSTNAGNNYSGKYIKLANDIYLNDETFTYESTNGGQIKVQSSDGKSAIIPNISPSGTTSSHALTNDTGVSLKQWTPIGTSSNEFYGNFDGDNHTIYGLYINSTSNYQGLFGYLGINNTTISNLTISNSAVISTGNYVGAFVGGGYINSFADLYFTQCKNYSHILGKSGSTGGIVGSISSNDGPTTTFSSCLNEGYVNGEKCTGTTKMYGWISTCFVEGTKVLTSNDENYKSYINIEDLKVGDYVASYNHENNQIEMKKVTKVFVHNDGDYNVLNLTVKNKATNELTTVEVTKEHRFYSLTKQDYVALEYINVGDILKLFDGDCEVISIENSRIVDVVYNIEVEDNHNYFVTNADILVHNAKGSSGSLIVE